MLSSRFYRVWGEKVKVIEENVKNLLNRSQRMKECSNKLKEYAKEWRNEDGSDKPAHFAYELAIVLSEISDEIDSCFSMDV